MKNGARAPLLGQPLGHKTTIVKSICAISDLG